MTRFEQRVRNSIEKRNMIPHGTLILLGVSGGADSISMLYALNTIYKNSDCKLAVCHVNHNIHDEADNHAKFVQSECEKLGIPCTIMSVDVAQRQTQCKLSLEHAAREERYEALRKVAKELSTKYNREHYKIALAHTQNDSCETMLINLIRGTGTKGLCGIPPIRDDIVRPLIDATREDVIEYLNNINQTFVNDPTNDEMDATRNKIRHQVIPFLNETFSGQFNCLGTFARLNEILILEREAHEQFSEMALDTIVKNGSISVHKYLSLSLGARLEVLRKMCQGFKVPTMAHLLEVNKMVASTENLHGTIRHLYDNYQFVITRSEMWVESV